MSYTKGFKDYPELILLLKDRGLVVNDEKLAINFLKSVHYYRLSAYFIPFYTSSNLPCFVPHTSFEDVVLLYSFDQELRDLVFKHIEQVEILLRAQITHIHARKYGAFGYAKQENALRRHIDRGKLFNEFMAQLQQEQKRSGEEFVAHIQDKYGTDVLPIWAAVEILSFGSLVKFFKLLLQNEQLDVMSYFGVDSLRLNVFINWLETLVYVRNLCAHHSRLWNKQFVRKFKHDTRQNFATNGIKTDKVFFVLSVIAKLTRKHNIVDEIQVLLARYPNVAIEKMGFPVDWKSILSRNSLGLNNSH